MTETLLTPLSIVMAFIGVIEATLGYRVVTLQGRAQMIFVWFMVTFPLLILVGFFYVQLTAPLSWYPPSELNKASLSHLEMLKQTSNKVKEDTLKFANDLSTIKEDLTDLLVDIDQKAKADELKQNIIKLVQKSEETEKLLKIAISEQEKALKEPGKTTTPLPEGWIFLGKIDSERKAWSNGNLPNINKDNPRIKVGEKLTVTDDIYLRGEPSGKWHTSGKVTSVVKKGDKVEVIRELSYPLAKGGGFFIWAYVKVES